MCGAMAPLRGEGLEARARRLRTSLSKQDLHEVFGAVKIFTCWQRGRPTAALVTRKVQGALTRLGGDEELLRFLVHSAVVKACLWFGSEDVGGVAPAVRGCHMTDVAEEIAHAHARGVVVSEGAIGVARLHVSHMLRIGREVHTRTRESGGAALLPIATDRHIHAIDAIVKGEGEAAAIERLGASLSSTTLHDAGYFVNLAGTLIGTALCVAMIDRGDSLGPVCCGTCYDVVDDPKELTLCNRCGDHLFCKRCLATDGRARHACECERVRGDVREPARQVGSCMRESARRVAIVQLDVDGIICPTTVKSISSPLVRSSLLETAVRAVSESQHSDLVIYWRLLTAFLSEPDGDGQELGEASRAPSRIEAATHAVTDDDGIGATRKAPVPLSERRRVQRAKRVAERTVRDEARAAAAAAAVAEADAVLERQMARPDATSAMLTSVIAKRAAAATPDVVARARARRDALKIEERAVRRRPTKGTPASPEHASVERARREGAEAAAQRAAAALVLQRHARAWLRGRKKARRKRRSRAAKLIQRRARAWLRPPTPKGASLEAPATPSTQPTSAPTAPPPPVAAPPPPPAVEEGDGDVSCVVCLARQREVVLLPCRHLSLCARCAAGVSVCPMCRGAVEDTMLVFV